jgi:hypothetical protein
MVRATSIFSRLGGPVGTLAHRIASFYGGRVGPMATFTSWQMMNPWRRFACHIAPIVVALFIGYIGIDLFGDRFNPREVVSATVVPNDVRPGETASIVLTASDDRPCDGVVHKWLIDSKGVIFDLTDNQVFMHYDKVNAKSFQFVREFPIPYGMNAGEATYRAHAVRWCNFLQQNFWPITNDYSYKFNVVRPPAKTLRK